MLQPLELATARARIARPEPGLVVMVLLGQEQVLAQGLGLGQRHLCCHGLLYSSRHLCRGMGRSSFVAFPEGLLQGPAYAGACGRGVEVEQVMCEGVWSPGPGLAKRDT